MLQREPELNVIPASGAGRGWSKEGDCSVTRAGWLRGCAGGCVAMPVMPGWRQRSPSKA